MEDSPWLHLVPFVGESISTWSTYGKRSQRNCLQTGTMNKKGGQVRLPKSEEIGRTIYEQSSSDFIQKKRSEAICLYNYQFYQFSN